MRPIIAVVGIALAARPALEPIQVDHQLRLAVQVVETVLARDEHIHQDADAKADLYVGMLPDEVVSVLPLKINVHDKSTISDSVGIISAV